KDLVNVLQRVKDYRNNWKGHSGVWGPSDHQQHLALLEAELAAVRSVMKARWNLVDLLRPGVSTYSRGIYQYEAELLKGTRTPYRQLRVQTLRPMEAGAIHLLHEGRRDPIELVPLLKLGPEPPNSTNAVYFYNRSENGQVRWVSYHYAQPSELSVADAPLLARLRELNLVTA
ncbi:MAG: hypothetical protein ACRC1H_06600, partial [Caldilineaceae bacterium]